ncbi:hypothetical protein CFE70_007355 [Pyrenophora teres f. teres 0-1]|uniref:Uncharacterized protein n=2 Tax=Pyrenophora teres f. teres TaxID=97479 RepID=E3RPC1_PYRTT|nr:hypothetical protein PTT_10475 [Pyrenophora teres f. teres 0-1]KAE8859148.1 hypothetical protein PTNB73_08628 [Pyrenophora teres f. teres]KAK1908787.1 hypothetical protein P3342_009638 [Pyrenophora teres f. teres]
MDDTPRRSVSDFINTEKRRAEYQHIEEARKLSQEDRTKWMQHMNEKKEKQVQAEQACSSAGLPKFYLTLVMEMNLTIDEILDQHGISATGVQMLMDSLENMEQYVEVQDGIKASKAFNNPDDTKGQHQIPVPRMTSQELKRQLAGGQGRGSGCA